MQTTKDKNHWPEPESMAGTECTGEYKVHCASLRGRVGVRNLSGGSSRIRVEPRKGASPKTIARMEKSLGANDGWKQPGDSGQHRFSTVVGDNEKLAVTLSAAKKAIGHGKLKSFVDFP